MSWLACRRRRATTRGIEEMGVTRALLLFQKLAVVELLARVALNSADPQAPPHATWRADDGTPSPKTPASPKGS